MMAGLYKKKTKEN